MRRRSRIRSVSPVSSRVIFAKTRRFSRSRRASPVRVASPPSSMGAAGGRSGSMAISTPPIVITSPTSTSLRVTRSPFTSVPLADPRSMIHDSPSLVSSRVW